MRINGVWVGWGLGDWSHNPDGTDKDPTVRQFRGFARGKFRNYAGHLADNNKFDEELELVVREMQGRYVASARLALGTYIPGVLDLPTQEACNFKRKDKQLPIIFTVEGHMSVWDIGPCAYVASTLAGQGVCWWQGVNYVNNTIPFKTNTGVDELIRLLRMTVLPTGRPFPLGTPWGPLGFSEGAMVTGRTFLKLRESSDPFLKQRYADMTRAIAFGDPMREKNVIADWVPDPPKANTQGISDVRLTDTPDWWKVHSRTKDLYTENTDDEAGENCTSIFKIIANNSWGGLLQRFGDLLRDPMDGTFDVAKALMSGGMFVFNMGPHGTYDLNPCVEYMRGVGQKRVEA